MKTLRLADGPDKFYRRVCSKHFSPDDVLKLGNAGRRIVLKKTAVPQLNESISDADTSSEENWKSSRKLSQRRKSRRAAQTCYICKTKKNRAESYFKSVIAHFQLLLQSISSYSTEYITLYVFSFPKKSNLKSCWKEACNIDAATCIDNLILCHKHFLDDDFINEEKSTLKKTAIPTQLLQQTKRSTHSCIICGAGQLEKLSYFG